MNSDAFGPLWLRVAVSPRALRPKLGFYRAFEVFAKGVGQNRLPRPEHFPQRHVVEPAASRAFQVSVG
jgi:hypothetical protein